MKKCIFFVALLMSVYVMNGMERKDKIYTKGEGDVSLSRESLKPLSQQFGKETPELKNLIEKRHQLICKRIGHISLALCCAMLFIYKCDLCPFLSR